MDFRQKVISLCLAIPKGKVTTYGALATLAGNPRGARLVGGILHFTKEDLPWHRVVNRDGFISNNCPDHPKLLQRSWLQSEGIEVSDNFMIDLKIYGWWG